MTKEELVKVSRLLEGAMKELIAVTIEQHGADARTIVFAALQMATTHCLRAEYYARQIDPNAQDALDWYVDLLRETVEDHKRLLGPAFARSMGG